MEDDTSSYTSHNFDAIDAQISQMAEREGQITRSQRIKNNISVVKLASLGLLAIGLFTILLAIAYRIAFPAKEKIVYNETLYPQNISQSDSILEEEELDSRALKENYEDIILEKEVEIASLKNMIYENEMKTSNLENRIKLQIDKSIDHVNLKSNVVVFQRSASNLSGFRDVVTRWIYDKSTDNDPQGLSCYIEKRNKANDTLMVEIGDQIPGQLAIIRKWQASKGITREDFNKSFAKCQWQAFKV